MGKFLLLAFRNIFRNRRRTIMTLIVVGGGVAGLLMAGGYFAFMTHGLRESTINNGLGHLQIFTADYFKRDEVRVLDTGIENWRQVAANVSSVQHVRGVAPRIDFNGMVSNGTKAAGFMGNAVDPVAENQSRICYQCCIGQRSRFQAVRRSRSAHWNRFGQVDERQGRRWVDDTGNDI